MYYRTSDSEAHYRCLGIQGNEVTYEWVTKDNSGWLSVLLEAWNTLLITLNLSNEKAFNDALWRRYGLGNERDRPGDLDECWLNTQTREYRRVITNSGNVFFEYVTTSSIGRTVCTAGQFNWWKGQPHVTSVSLREYLEAASCWIESHKKKLAENERAKVVESINKLAGDLITATANGALMTMKTEPIWDVGRNVQTVITLTYKEPTR